MSASVAKWVWIAGLLTLWVGDRASGQEMDSAKSQQIRFPAEKKSPSPPVIPPAELRNLDSTQLAEPVTSPQTYSMLGLTRPEEVWFKFRVNKEGSAYFLKQVWSSSDNQLLMDVARERMKSLTFVQPSRTGQKGSAWMYYRMEFQVPPSYDVPPIPPPLDTSEGVLPGFDESVAVEIPPEMIHEQTPTYPIAAFQEHLTGAVMVKALVGRKGTVLKAVVAKTSGQTQLDNSALAASYQCTFKPALQNGAPVACWVTYQVKFTLPPKGHHGSASEPGAPKMHQDSFPTAEQLEEYGGVSPDMIFEEPPVYPMLAKTAGLTGTVWIHALVGKGGEVTAVRLAKGSGTPSIDESAMKAAQKCRFDPGTLQGEPVACWVTYKVEFKLN